MNSVMLWLALWSGWAGQGIPGKVPDELRIPDGQALVFEAHGVGQQVYSCKVIEGKYGWSLIGPEAKLLGADGQVVGRHFAGPTWEAKDGSRVKGKAVASVPSPDADSVAWLRLEATGHEGAGVMSGVVSLQRLNTKGGKAAASGCDVSHAGAEARIPYEADYYFYEKRGGL